MQRAKLVRLVRTAGDGMRRALPEILAGTALVAGWTLLTIAVAGYAPPRLTWLVSIGLFLLSCFGWAPLLVLARYGLYSATRDEKRGRHA